MADKPEERARAEIDRLLAAAGWSVQSMSEANNLPPPDVIAQEIVDDLEAALEQFRLIAADLGSPQDEAS